jgi:hypothetical protein
MRKLILLLLAILFSLQVYSQTMYEKYNNYNNRYEYFDTYGNMIGYKIYDRSNDRWVYYKNNQPDNDLHLTETAKYIGTVQAQMQAKYDYNYQRLTNSIEALQNKINKSSYSDYVKKSCIDYFNMKCIKGLSSMKVDLTDISETTRLIKWFNDSMDYFIDFYVKLENKSKN